MNIENGHFKCKMESRVMLACRKVIASIPFLKSYRTLELGLGAVERRDHPYDVYVMGTTLKKRRHGRDDNFSAPVVTAFQHKCVRHKLQQSQTKQEKTKTYHQCVRKD